MFFTKADRQMLERIDRESVALLLLLRNTLMSALTDLQSSVTTLTTAVANETTVDQSVLTLVQGMALQITTLSAELADAVASGDAAGVEAAVASLAVLGTTINANATSLAAAVTNTPAPAPAA